MRGRAVQVAGSALDEERRHRRPRDHGFHLGLSRGRLVALGGVKYLRQQAEVGSGVQKHVLVTEYPVNRQVDVWACLTCGRAGCYVPTSSLSSGLSRLERVRLALFAGQFE
jgi:hypothetical protein